MGIISWQGQIPSKPGFMFSSVTQSYLTLCDPMDCTTPGLPVHHQLPEFTQTHVHWVSDAIQPSHPLLLPPSIFTSIRVFSNESVLHISWPKYWSFNFSISPSNEYSGLTSTRIVWFDLLSVQGTLKSLLPLNCCTEMTQRDGMGREVGGKLRMGNTCKSTADSCQCTAKTTTIL